MRYDATVLMITSEAFPMMRTLQKQKYMGTNTAYMAAPTPMAAVDEMLSNPK